MPTTVYSPCRTSSLHHGLSAHLPSTVTYMSSSRTPIFALTIDLASQIVVYCSHVQHDRAVVCRPDANLHHVDNLFCALPSCSRAIVPHGLSVHCVAGPRSTFLFCLEPVFFLLVVDCSISVLSSICALDGVGGQAARRAAA